MEYLEIKTPRWDNKEKTTLTANVNFVTLGFIEFTTSASVTEDYAKAIYTEAVAMGPAEFQPPIISIDTLIKNRLSGLKFIRREKEVADIIFRGTKYAAGLNDQTRINNLVLTSTAAGITEVDFKTADGYKTIKVEELAMASSAMTKRSEACFTNERVHTIALNNLYEAGDRDGLEKYDITTGWPDNIYS